MGTHPLVVRVLFGPLGQTGAVLDEGAATWAVDRLPFASPAGMPTQFAAAPVPAAVATYPAMPFAAAAAFCSVSPIDHVSVEGALVVLVGN